MSRMICRRLRRGADLLESIRGIAREEHLQGAVVLSAVGCVGRARVRDASGVTARQIEEPCEIVSLMGTVSVARCHLHISLSREDLSTLGGHLMTGCIINTTCELVLMETGWRYGLEDDPETGYNEITFTKEDPL